MLWIPRSADLEECVNQGALVVWFKCNLEIERGTSGSPVDRDGIPGVLDMDVIPVCDECCKVSEGGSNEDGEHKPPVI